MPYAVMFNSEAKRESFLGLKIHTSGQGNWVKVNELSTREAAERFISGKDPNKYKIVQS